MMNRLQYLLGVLNDLISGLIRSDFSGSDLHLNELGLSDSLVDLFNFLVMERSLLLLALLAACELLETDLFLTFL